MPGEPRSRDLRRHETRRRLLDAAAEVFAREGYDGASVEAIAGEAGFTKGAVYSNFSSKEDLFIAVLEEHVAEHLRDAELTFSAAPGSLDDVRDGGRTIAQQVEVERDRWLLFIEIWTRAAREPRLRRRVAGLYERWRAQVGRLIAEHFDRLGVPLPAPAEQLGAAAIALAEGHALQSFIDPEQVPSGAYGDMIAYLVAGMAVAGAGLDIDDLDRRAEAVS